MNILAILDHDIFGNDYISIAKKIAPHISMIWYRIKNCDTLEIYNRAKLLRSALPETYLCLSEKADIASILNFNAVHLNAHSLPYDAVKKSFTNLDIGYSAHSIDETNIIKADYYTLSPIFKTVKNYDYQPIGVIPITSDKKIFALGGIEIEKYDLLRESGYFGIAGISLIDTFIK